MATPAWQLTTSRGWPLPVAAVQLPRRPPLLRAPGAASDGAHALPGPGRAPRRRACSASRRRPVQRAVVRCAARHGLLCLCAGVGKSEAGEQITWVNAARHGALSY
eukprot:353281-Chlamydomonas_euryale.AAC.2